MCLNVSFFSKHDGGTGNERVNGKGRLCISKQSQHAKLLHLQHTVKESGHHMQAGLDNDVSTTCR